MKISYIAFSERGYDLAADIASQLGGEAARCGAGCDLHDWTEAHFAADDALVFVGAAGIAVRAIAPFVRDKASDPAVIVMDELALHVIPILSGHLGGANRLASRIAELKGSDCVITTATDINGRFAVDEWAVRQGCTVMEPERIAAISSGILAGETLTVRSRWPVTGDVPDGLQVADNDGITGDEDCDISLDIMASDDSAIHLVPCICVLGIGCRRGASADAMESLLGELLERSGVCEAAIRCVATIDIKADEAGIAEFCRRHGWGSHFYSGSDLMEIEGDFSASNFVRSVTGADNICERSAVICSGGTLIQPKISAGGVTMALAAADYYPVWEW